MPLSVIVVGAGIGGLTAAAALSQAGHHVEIFEKSAFAGEVGAALLITPNGERVLTHLGFDFKRARADDMISQEVLDGISFNALHRADLTDARERFGAPVYTIHRVDLHDELMLLGTGIKLRLSSGVVDADPEAGSITLSDGSVHTADLIVAADGVHSVLRQSVLGDGVSHKSAYSGMNAFRFLIPTSRIRSAAGFEDLWKTKGKGASVLADTSVQTERHMVWYTARNGEVHNFAGIYEKLKPRTDEEDLKTLMLDEFGHYHPLFRSIIDMADDVTDWPLSFHDPLPWWHRGKILLIGDAAHPMLPFSGQGANQAIEDGGAVGAIFHKGNETPADVPHLLDLFEKVRRLRASRIQTMSKVRMGREQEIQHELKLYADPPGSHVPDTFAERYQHDYIFDVYTACKQALAGETAPEHNNPSTNIISHGPPTSNAPEVLAT